MKKRIIAILLCAVVLTLLIPHAGRAEETLSFISVDDKLPAELINTLAYYGGNAYVPYWLFSNYNLGISYRLQAVSATATLSSGDKKLHFNITTGKTHDDDDYRYSVSAVMRGGTVYLPLSFVCSFFGTFSYAHIGGNEYGSILRLYTGREELTNEELLRYAKPAMQRYYNLYNREETTASPAVTPAVPTTPIQSGPETPPRNGDIVRLGLEGRPDGTTLELLDRLGMTACFFLTEEEIRSDPDMVRRIACEGYMLGIACSEGTEEEYRGGAELLQELARVRTVMAVVPEGTTDISGLALFSRTTDSLEEDDLLAAAYAAISVLERSGRDTTLVFPCGGENGTALNVLCYYLRDQGFTVTALRESDGN